jgi:hypothetical protein
MVYKKGEMNRMEKVKKMESMKSPGFIKPKKRMAMSGIKTTIKMPKNK